MAVTPKKTLYMFSLGGRESSVLLEQRVHHEPDQRQRSKDSANYVPRFVPQLKNPLEQVSCISCGDGSVCTFDYT